MDLFNSLMRAIIGGYCRLFGDAHPLVSLTPLSIVIGILMLWVFAKVSDQKAIERTKKRLQAYLLELRLYGDDLGLVWGSQKNLFAANLRYMALMLKPAIYLTIPLVVLMIHMDAFYGWKPLPVGEAAVVTMQASEGADTGGAAPSLAAPQGIVVETPAVHAKNLGQFSWRIRPEQATDGRLQFDWNGAKFEKSIDAGNGWRYLSSKKVRSAWDAVWNPGEDRLAAANVEWVEMVYPEATIDFAGLKLHWIIWFLVISIVAGYALKDYFGVVL